ncbi:MAG: hypothetical protein ABIM74_01585 [candidate division WOR-3 bacterium]
MTGILLLMLSAEPTRCATPLVYERQTQAALVPKTWGKRPKAGPSEGDTVLLWVMDLSVMPPDWKKIPFVCMRVTQDAYIMVDAAALDSGYVTTTTVDSIESAFQDKSLGPWPDTGIYVIDTSAFGPPPDELDADPRIYLLYYIIEGYMGYQFDGYFNFADEYPDSVAWNHWGMHSNERECIYLDCHNESPATPRMLGVLAHEFQHLIHWLGDADETPWVNEGCSELAMFLYGAPDPIVEFPGNPDNSLVTWSTGFSDYVKVYLWTLYLYEQFDSGFALTRALVDENANSVFGVENALSGQGVPGMTEAFSMWVLANYLDDTGTYGYYGEDLPPFAHQGSYSSYPVGPVSKTVHLWAADYIRFTNVPDGLQFTFNGQDGKHFFLLAMLFDSSGPTMIYDISPSNANQDTTVYFSEVGYQYYKAVIAIAGYPDPLSGDSSNQSYTFWANGTGTDEGSRSEKLRFWSDGKGVFLGLPYEEAVSIRVYDAGGRMIQGLHEGTLAAGNHEFTLDPWPRGIRFVVLRYEGKNLSLKIVH